MIIIIKSPPYTTEKPLGALFIGLSSAEQQIPTRVIFVEDGIHNLYANQNPEGTLAIPSISDVIHQFYGLIHFYAILPGELPNDGNHDLFSSMRHNFTPGIKIITYADLVKMIANDPQNPIVL